MCYESTQKVGITMIGRAHRQATFLLFAGRPERIRGGA